MHNTIAFSHANSFPAGTYRLLFEAWRKAGWRVIAVPRIGHDPAFPVSNNWPHLRDELLAFLLAQAPGEKVHLVGHSLGGYLSLLAACKRPLWVKSVVLLDSPVVAGWRVHALYLMKLSGTAARRGPGRVSMARRHQWPSADAAHAHFAAKPMFARWDPRVLRDYIACGIEADPDTDTDTDTDADADADTPGGVRLAFHRDIETLLYNTLPHHLGQVLRRHPPACPVSFIGGKSSAEVGRVGMAATQALTQMTHGRIEWLQGGHLFPMERPANAAAAVLRAIGRASGG